MSLKKQVEITSDIVEKIESVTKTTIDPDNIVVFEAAALSTRPLHKPGSFYHEARTSRAMLEEMATALNSGEESVPLHTLHQQGEELPVGKVFSASVHDEIDGSATLRAMFYLPLTEKDLIEKINLSILDEVSVGVKSDQALCSKCGFDYFGEDADFTHLWDHTCENGHVLGEDGVHLKLTGLDKWMELSLVSRGASDKPKILSRAKQLVSKDEHDRMAADGTPLEALVLFTSTQIEAEASEVPKKVQVQKETVVEIEGEEVQSEEMEFDAQSAIEEINQRVDALVAKFEGVSEEDPSPIIVQEETAEAEQEDIAAELEAAKARIAELEEAAASEETTETETEIPTGGVSASAVTDANAKVNSGLRAQAFKTNRNRR